MRISRVLGTTALLVGALAPPAAAAAPPVPFALSGCDYIEAVVRVPASAVAPLVPADFEVLATGGTAVVNVGGADCRTATSGTESGTGAFGWVLVRVARPAAFEYRGAGVNLWFYRLAHFVIPGDVYHHVATAAGAEQTPVEEIDASVPSALSELVIRSGASVHRVQVPLSAPDGGTAVGGARWREFHEVTGGYAMLEATLRPDDTAAQLAGVVRPAEGSLAHIVLGPAAAGQALFGTAFAVEDAVMEVLPKP